MSSLKTAFFCNETGGALLRTFITKGVSVFGALGLFVVIGQLYGPRGVGVYAMSQSNGTILVLVSLSSLF